MRALRVVRLVIAALLLLLLVLFTLSNTAALRLSLWPTDYNLTLPASIVILGAMVVAFLAGAVLVWLGELGQRRRARQAEQTVKLLEEQVKMLRAQRSPPTPPNT
jgi:lipopolysaccharide assembly protein A